MLGRPEIVPSTSGVDICELNIPRLLQRKFISTPRCERRSQWTDESSNSVVVTVRVCFILSVRTLRMFVDVCLVDILTPSVSGVQ